MLSVRIKTSMKRVAFVLFVLMKRFLKGTQYHHLLCYYIIIISLPQYISITTIFFQMMKTDIQHRNNTDYEKDY